jgi:hypothetical protein
MSDWAYSIWFRKSTKDIFNNEKNKAVYRGSSWVLNSWAWKNKAAWFFGGISFLKILNFLFGLWLTKSVCKMRMVQNYVGHLALCVDKKDNN